MTWSEAQRDSKRFLELHDDDGHLVASACHDGAVWDCAVLVRSGAAIVSVVEWTSAADDDRIVRAWCEGKLWWGHREYRAGRLPLRIAGGRPLAGLQGPRRKKRDELARLLPWSFLRGAA